MIRLHVRPAGKGMFFYGLEAEPWRGPSSQPLLDAAREELAAGAWADEVIEMWHEGGSTWALRSTVGQAARLRVDESGRPRFRKWEPSSEIRRRCIRGAKG